MKRHEFGLRPRVRRLLYALGLLLLLSGICWAWLNHLDESGQANELLRSTKTWLIALHGFSAVTFVLLLGALLVSHVRRAWRAGKNRRDGAMFLASAGLLALSGYALYYIGNEGLRAAVSLFHLWLGVAAPVLLYWHMRSGKTAVNRE